MALVSVGFEWTTEWADNSGNTTRRTFRFVGTIDTYAAAVSAITAALPILNAVTDAVLVSHRLTEVTVENALVLPGSGVENENQAFFSAKIGNDPLDSATFSVPAADPDIFVALSGPGANQVDMSDLDVIAYVGLFDAAGPFTLSDGETINVATARGKRRHVKNSNG